MNESVCRVCNSLEVQPVLDLGQQPLANSFTQQPNQLQKYPLLLERCLECYHTQLNYLVPPSELFSNYLYLSGTSETMLKHFAWIAQKATSESNRVTNNILELASNDGCQLDCFKALGWQTYGVDPAVNLSKIAQDKGHQISIGFWGVDQFELPTVDIIVAQNVLAHVPKPVAFLSACLEIMSDQTKLYLQTSQCDMYLNGEFDTIYHEHLSYFTAHSYQKLAERVGLVIIGFEIVSVHGQSFLVTMQKPVEQSNHCQALFDRIKAEKAKGLTGETFWVDYREKALGVSAWLRGVCLSIKDDYQLVGYGAAAKGITLLNYLNLPFVRLIVDDSGLKQNTYSPGLNIPVRARSDLDKFDGPLAVLVLAWNFFDEIVKKLQEFEQVILVIRPFPMQTVYTLTETGLEIVENPSS